MKIGVDCRFYSPKFTGIGRYTYEIVQRIIKINEKLVEPYRIVLFFNAPEFVNFAESEYVKKNLVNCRHYSLEEQTKFLFKLNDENLDLMHFTHFNVPILYRRPFVVTIHDLILHFFPGKKMNKFHHRLAYNLTLKCAAKRSKKIITVSNNTKDDIVQHLGVKSEKIEVVYNGVGENFQKEVNVAECEQTLQKYGILNVNFLLYTGVWRNHKNLIALLRAFSILRRKKAFHLKLVITGKPDPFYPEIKKTVKSLNLENDVVFTGLVDESELVHLYNGAVIYVFPSLYEGFGLPPLEAMRCGTPVAASRSSSIPEICGEESALYFNPHDPQDIADKIEELYKDPAEQARLIELGFHRAGEFSWDKAAEKTFEIYKNILDHV